MINQTLLSKNDTYIVACSAGPDSMYLLDNLFNLGYKIIVCHVNYNSRKESIFAKNIIEKYCKNKKIKLFLKNIFINKIIKKNNFEALARKIRYDFFCEIATTYDCKILIAHNLTDNIETYLLQKQRKIIVSHWGLASNTFYGKNKNIIIRPMLNVLRKDIVKYLNENKIAYDLDKTNELDIYERNKIRKKILKENQYQKYLNNIIIDNEILKKNKIELKKEYDLIIDSQGNINLKKLLNFSLIKQQQIIFMYFNNLNLESLILNRKKSIIKEIVKQLNSKKPNIFIDINNFYILVKEYNKVFIIKKNELETF